MVRLAASNAQQRAKRAPASQLQSAETKDHDLRFSLTHALQTSLELDEVLGIFFSGIQDFISLDGLNYRISSSAGPDKHISLGKQAKHSIEYRLTTDTASMTLLHQAPG